MRPALLNPLFAPVETLPGVGPKLAPLIARATGREAGAATVLDLLFHLPSGLLDRRNRPKIAEAPHDTLALIEARVVEHRASARARGRAPYRVLVEDDTGDVELVFFLANHDWIARALPVGETRWISGRLELWDGHLQMVHPDRILDARELAKLPPIEPTYPLTAGLPQRIVQRACAAAAARVPEMPEWLDSAKIGGLSLPSFREALVSAHAPRDLDALEPNSPARMRLAYDELLASQASLAMMRAHLRRRGGRAQTSEGRLAAQIESALPFTLTESQRRALDEIRGDLDSQRRMVRLLQGDVGSGKTIVALLAMAQVVEAGRQCAFMAPTELLAAQHAATFEPLARAAGVRVVLLTGRDTAAQRRRTLAAIEAGEVDIVVGTHALLQETVVYKDLGFAVVDEQHRFGVHQRLALADKGDGADILVMTATPIPRTLVLTYFGDMDVSALTGKPAGRRPVDTRALPLERIEEVTEAIGRAVASGAQVYWVCPLVEENEEIDAAAAEERARDLRQRFGDHAVSLAHGRMKGGEKDAAMERFRRGDAPILVATTVIEVGVDVPAARAIVIEHAERFGLAQLHQLRGRVGRGGGASACLLLYRAPLGETAKARIEILRRTDDGFQIAEEDLRLRGEGELLGARQSGTPGFRFARMDAHGALLRLAREEAERRMAAGGLGAHDARSEALRVLLYLFGKEDAARLVDAG
jgi:ATP-dependent DNA helicase RecG